MAERLKIAGFMDKMTVDKDYDLCLSFMDIFRDIYSRI